MMKDAAALEEERRRRLQRALKRAEDYLREDPDFATAYVILQQALVEHLNNPF